MSSSKTTSKKTTSKNSPKTTQKPQKSKKKSKKKTSTPNTQNTTTLVQQPPQEFTHKTLQTLEQELLEHFELRFQKQIQLWRSRQDLPIVFFFDQTSLQHPGIRKIEAIFHQQKPNPPYDQIARFSTGVAFEAQLHQALDIALQLQDGLVQATVDLLLHSTNQFVDPIYQSRILQDPHVLNRFPWFHAHPSGTLLLSIQEKHGFSTWPLEAEPEDVVQWTRQGFEHTSPQFAHLLTGKTQEGRNIDWYRWEQEFFRPTEYNRIQLHRASLSGIAVLYLAEQSYRQIGVSKAPRLFPFSVEPASTRLYSSFAGGDPQAPKHNKGDVKVLYNPDNYVTRLRMVYPDGNRTEIELDFEQDFTYNTIFELFGLIRKRYGQSVIRDLSTLFVFSWAARTKPRQAFWWWAKEHLHFTQQTSKSARTQLLNNIELLKRTQFEVFYKNGPPLTGPLISESPYSTRSAKQFTLHPALYRGVTEPNGSLGRYFWTMPVQALKGEQRQHNTYPLLIGLMTGPLWRARLPEYNKGKSLDAKISVRRLTLYIGLQERRDRKKQQQVAEILNNALDQAQQDGTIAGWKVSGPKEQSQKQRLQNLNNTITLSPGSMSKQVIDGQLQAHPPAWLPSTPAELQQLRNAKHWTQAELADNIGVTRQTIITTLKQDSNAPLSVNVRMGLHKYLWEKDEPEQIIEEGEWVLELPTPEE
ncbi:MAG: helix-turn-helix domain-containing protein [Myxococcota bacterium]